MEDGKENFEHAQNVNDAKYKPMYGANVNKLQSIDVILLLLFAILFISWISTSSFTNMHHATFSSKSVRFAKCFGFVLNHSIRNWCVQHDEMDEWKTGEANLVGALNAPVMSFVKKKNGW